jgi:arginine-tRNA-protein transferase
MISLIRYETPPGPCGYLPGQTWRFLHELVATLTPAEYEERLRQGWRRFGHLLFRPTCADCTACRSLRVDVSRFRPNRSQRRNIKLNGGVVELSIGRPTVSLVTLDLYDRYHAYQTAAKGWPDHGPKDGSNFRESFTTNPFPVEEWRYSIHGQLVGVGFVDRVPSGLSAVSFFYDPAERHRGLGTWNVLKVIERARELGLSHVYLGYHVAGAASLEYKANFRPAETLDTDGVWRAFCH